MQKSRCVCETLTMPTAATKSKKAIFRTKMKVKVTRSLTLWPWKGHYYRSMQAKYEVSTSNSSKVIGNFKADNRQTNKQTDRQTNRQDKNNMPPIIRSGGIKITFKINNFTWWEFFCKELWHCTFVDYAQHFCSSVPLFKSWKNLATVLSVGVFCSVRTMCNNNSWLCVKQIKVRKSWISLNTLIFCQFYCA